MVHPLVNQLRFTRSKWQEGLRGVSVEDGMKRFGPMNSIGWMVGHLANHEQSLWVKFPTNGELVVPELAAFGFGKPASTPNIDEVWDAYDKVIAKADEFLNTVTQDMLTTMFEYKGRVIPETIGTMLHRLTYHYYYHLGEGLAVRQILGHKDLPQMVGDIPAEYTYQAE